MTNPSPKFTFAIGIPTINRWDLLKPALEKYVQDFPTTQIFVLDNGQQKKDFQHYTITYINKDHNIGVAASWNELCKNIFLVHTHALMLNDDVYLGARFRVIQMLINNKPDAFKKTIRDDWSAFILPKTVHDKVGPFDQEFWPAYFEDRDYMRRMKLAGCSIVTDLYLNPFVYRSSQSAEKDKSLLNGFEKNKKYYIGKWGGLPGNETHSQPFNGIGK